MGVLDFYTMLAGGAWLAKETVKEVGERGSESHRSALWDQFVAEHTDLELERQLMKMVEDPACYNAVWERLEQFKRDNPVWCSQHEEKGYYSEWDNRYIDPGFGWQSIGKERLEFFKNYGSYEHPYYSIYGKSKYETQCLAANRKDVLNMLMQIQGKMTLRRARLEANNKILAAAKSQRKSSLF